MPSVSGSYTIDLRRLRLLAELQRHGTIAATAAALHLTPSAVSQQLAALSRQVGVPLLEKRGRGVVLTGAARLLLGHADAVAAQLERARHDLAAWVRDERGEVVVGSFASAVSGLLPAALAALGDRHPDLGVTVVEAEPPELFTRLDAGQVDVAVCVDYAAVPPRTDRRYRRRQLLVEPLDLALPGGHPATATADPVALPDLAEDPWVVGEPGSCCGAITRAVCAAAGFTPDIRHHVDDWQAVAALVAAGAGVALVPRLAQPVGRDGLVLRPVAGAPPTRTVFAAVRAGADRNPLLAAVVDALVAAGRPTGRTEAARGRAPVGP
jgi:DNA-binding transcriptional LysR family regulator